LHLRWSVEYDEGLRNFIELALSSNGCFDDLLSLIKEALPEDELLPKNFHEAKKFVKAIGIGYKCIDACINDCILFRKEYANAKFCLVCKTSRWKSVKGGVDGRHVHRVPAKVVRHFPLKKRLQRLFMNFQKFYQHHQKQQLNFSHPLMAH